MWWALLGAGASHTAQGSSFTAARWRDSAAVWALEFFDLISQAGYSSADNRVAWR